jgi:hypothetical protein
MILLIFLALTTAAQTAHIHNYQCVLSLETVRYIPQSHLLCAEFAFDSPFFDYSTQQLIFWGLEIEMQVKQNDTTHNVSLSNEVCNEGGNIGYVSDNRDIQGHKPSLFLCGDLYLNGLETDIHVHDIQSTNLNATLYTKRRDDRFVQCPVSKDKQIEIDFFNVSAIEKCANKNCSITCASITTGEGGEYVLPGQRTDLMEETTLSNELDVRDTRLWYVTRSGVMCIELVMSFSKDVTRFYLHDDTKLRLYNKQSTRSPVRFDNEVCVSTIANYISESPHAVWKNPSFLCTSEKVSHSSGRIQVQGTLSYVTITKSGHRVKSSKRITYKFVRPQKTLLHMKRYCDLDSVKSQCRECRQSCRAAIKGVGYLYCKDGWTYLTESEQTPLFLPFKSGNNGSLHYVTPGEESTRITIGKNVHWVLACLVGLILLIACIVELYLGCTCLSR